MLKARIDGNNAQQYFRQLPNRVRSGMVSKSDRMVGIVKEKTTPITPKRSGQLRRRFNKIPSFGDNEVEIRVYYRAINPKTGFDYAPIQETHQYRHYTTPGTGSRYLLRGMERSRETVKEMQTEVVRGAIRNGGL